MMMSLCRPKLRMQTMTRKLSIAAHAASMSAAAGMTMNATVGMSMASAAVATTIDF